MRPPAPLVSRPHPPYADFVSLLNKVGSRSGRARTVVADGSPGSLLRLRAAITVFFALDGFVFAGWVVRIPAIKEQTHASASALGLALLGVSAGAIVTMALVGRACRHFGNHPVTAVCAVLVSLAIALPPHMHAAWSLGAVLLVFGIGYGGINVAMNSAAVDLVNALGRPVMPSFHAAFSLGGMLGAGLGGLVASHLSPSWHLAMLAVIGLLVTAATTPTLLRHRRPGTPPRPAPPSSPRRPAWRSRPAARPRRPRRTARSPASSSSSAWSRSAPRTGRGRWPTGGRSTSTRTSTRAPERPRPGTRSSRSP